MALRPFFFPIFSRSAPRQYVHAVKGGGQSVYDTLIKGHLREDVLAEDSHNDDIAGISRRSILMLLIAVFQFLLSLTEGIGVMHASFGGSLQEFCQFFYSDGSCCIDASIRESPRYVQHGVSVESSQSQDLYSQPIGLTFSLNVEVLGKPPFFDTWSVGSRG